MSLKEQTIIFTDEDAQGNTIMQFPITKAGLIEDIMSITQGGTGATTARDACTNLGIFNSSGHLILPDGSEFWIE